MKKALRIIISGGGTGGHIFPAISIANTLQARMPDAEILFVGAENRMEMERVPAAGYKIIGLPVAGLNRKNLFKNIPVIVKLINSIALARKVIRDFQPDVVVGVGGYASGPVLRAAGQAGIPTLIQEQNSYAGVTNKFLAKKASKICVAYPEMERFFPKSKIVLTGNPVRNLLSSDEKRKEGFAFFNLDPEKKTILVLGGSLGARTLNQGMIQGLEKIKDSEVQFIWQSGKFYYEEARQALSAYPEMPVCLTDFISRMDLAYSVADLIISRAGAGSIAEFCILGKPVILIPSPNVAEDHQTKNALALFKKDAADMISDKDAVEKMVDTALLLINNEVLLSSYSEKIREWAYPEAASKITDEIINLVNGNNNG